MFKIWIRLVYKSIDSKLLRHFYTPSGKFWALFVFYVFFYFAHSLKLRGRFWPEVACWVLLYFKICRLMFTLVNRLLPTSYTGCLVAGCVWLGFGTGYRERNWAWVSWSVHVKCLQQCHLHSFPFPLTNVTCNRNWLLSIKFIKIGAAPPQMWPLKAACLGPKRTGPNGQFCCFNA